MSLCKTSPQKKWRKLLDWLTPGNKFNQGHITGDVGIVLSKLTSEDISQSEITRFPPNCNSWISISLQKFSVWKGQTIPGLREIANNEGKNPI